MSDFEKGYAQGFLAAKQELAEVTRERDELKESYNEEFNQHKNTFATLNTIRQQTAKECIEIVGMPWMPGQTWKDREDEVIAAIRKRFEVRG